MDKGTFRTVDLGEAAYIATVGYPVLSLCAAKGDPQRYEFVFPPEAKEVGEDYYRGGAIEAQRLVMIYRDLKGRLIRKRR